MLRVALSALLLFTAALALTACDSGQEPTTPKGSYSVEVARPLADLNLVFPDLSPRTIRLDSAFRASTPLTYEVRVDGSAVTAQLVGLELRLTPGAEGTATVFVKAIDLGGRTAETTFRYTLGPSPVGLSATMPDLVVTTGSPLRLSLLPYFERRTAQPVDYHVHASNSVVSALVEGDDLILNASGEGPVLITVEARVQGAVAAQSSFTANGVFSCPMPAPGEADYLALNGAAWTFAYRESTISSFGAVHTNRLGTATWQASLTKCTGGAAIYSVRERRSGTRTRTTPADTTQAPFDETRTFEITATATSLSIQEYRFAETMSPTPRPFLPAGTTSFVSFSASRGGPFGYRGASELQLEIGRGIVSMSSSSYSSRWGGEGSEWSITRTN